MTTMRETMTKTTKPKPKPPGSWRLSEHARDILRTLAETDRRSQGVTLEILLEQEAARRGIAVKTK
jgi:hypothetical protein